MSECTSIFTQDNADDLEISEQMYTELQMEIIWHSIRIYINTVSRRSQFDLDYLIIQKNIYSCVGDTLLPKLCISLRKH